MSGPNDLPHASPDEDALEWLGKYHGEVQVLPKVPIKSEEDFAVWYTPGVAEPCRAIERDPDMVYEETGKGNRIAIVTDGSRVLGLGDIGPLAGLPVMEGKAMLFKYLGGVDAIPICLSAHTADEIVETVERIAPAFGGINLEDIAQPKCFEILDRLRLLLDIPVWHDDQQGTATVALAGLINALGLVGKEIGRAHIALIGMGAANVATYRLLTAYGADPERIVAVDSRGILRRDRDDIGKLRDEYHDKYRIATETNPRSVAGGIDDALVDADVCISFAKSAENVIRPEWVKQMAPESIIFACANPIPEIYPEDALAAGARIVGTGRSDFPNQVNNSLAFPGVFRGALDVRARAISDEMAVAAAIALARATHELGLSEQRILPKMTDWQVVPEVAVAVGITAVQQGAARHELTEEQLRANAFDRINEARKATNVLMAAGIIADPDQIEPHL